MPSTFGAVHLAHDCIKRFVRPGDVCIDATAGRGRDTLFLCQLVGETGTVYAFDIQADAIASTRELLEQHGCNAQAHLFQTSHANMKQLVSGPVRCVVFNFGWLPGGDHNICTRTQSSLSAIEQGLKLLEEGGIMSLSIYYGKNNGFEERDAILEYLKQLDIRTYSVLVSQFYNRPNCPPISATIFKFTNL